jgi:hypothetical protein
LIRLGEEQLDAGSGPGSDAKERRMRSVSSEQFRHAAAEHCSHQNVGIKADGCGTSRVHRRLRCGATTTALRSALKSVTSVSTSASPSGTIAFNLALACLKRQQVGL